MMQSRRQGAQRLARVADDSHVRMNVAHDLLRVDVDADELSGDRESAPAAGAKSFSTRLRRDDNRKDFMRRITFLHEREVTPEQERWRGWHVDDCRAFEWMRGRSTRTPRAWSICG